MSMTQWAGGVVLAPLAGGGGLGAGKFLELVVGLLSSLLGWTPHPGLRDVMGLFRLVGAPPRPPPLPPQTHAYCFLL